MSEPNSTPLPGKFSLNDLISILATPQASPHAQQMWDWNNAVSVLALTLDGEGRSQSITGRAAIAWTVKNRQKGLGPAADKDKAIPEICLRRLQYSTWFRAGGEENYDRTLRMAAAQYVGSTVPVPPALWKRYQESRYIAAGVLLGDIMDPTLGATHYLTVHLYKTLPPAWVKTATGAKVIEDHIFLAGVR